MHGMKCRGLGKHWRCAQQLLSRPQSAFPCRCDTAAMIVGTALPHTHAHTRASTHHRSKNGFKKRVASRPLNRRRGLCRGEFQVASASTCEVRPLMPRPHHGHKHNTRPPPPTPPPPRHRQPLLPRMVIYVNLMNTTTSRHELFCEGIRIQEYLIERGMIEAPTLPHALSGRRPRDHVARATRGCAPSCDCCVSSFIHVSRSTRLPSGTCEGR